MKILITGGAGFLGSNLVDALLKKGEKVLVYDNFSTGQKKFISSNLKNPNFKLIKSDLLDFKKLKKALKDIDFVYHLAGHADVKSGYFDHFIDHNQNLETTHNLLEAMHQNNTKNIAFASTSAVYGDPAIHPTPENHPLNPTSLYGASKAAAEKYISAYSSYFNFKTYIFRFTPLMGQRYHHGIVVNILKLIRSKPVKLELLTDGTPKKTFVDVEDAISAMFTAVKKSKEQVGIFNVGNDEILTVDQIISLILKKMNFNAKKHYKGSGGGWPGDNPIVYLDSSKICSLGWKPKTDFKNSLEKTINYLLKNSSLLD